MAFNQCTHGVAYESATPCPECFERPAVVYNPAHALSKYYQSWRRGGETIEAMRERRRAEYAAYQDAKKARAAYLASQKGVKALNARTCQICGRDICANTGVIAHHGYERPQWGGYQTASCSGARELPLEASSEALRKRVENLALWINEAQASLRAAHAEETPASYAWKAGRHESAKYSPALTRATFDAWRETDEGKEAERAYLNNRSYTDSTPFAFDAVKLQAIRGIERQIAQYKGESDFQRPRLAAWKQTESAQFEGGAFMGWIKL